MRRIPLVPLALLTILSTAAPSARAADPTMSECLSANETAIKLRGNHNLRQARDQSLVCSASSCPGEVRDVCRKRVTDLNLAIATIVFEVKDASGNDVSGVTVTLDGEAFVDHLDGTAVAVDPGDHAFSFAVTGHPTVEKRIVIYEGEKARRERIQLGNGAAIVAPLPPPATPSNGSTPKPPPAKSEPPPPQQSSPGLGTQKILGLAVGGIGVAGVAVGSVFGVLTFSAWSSAKNACGSTGPSQCTTNDPNGVTSDHKTAVTDGTISSIAFIAGGALVATGAVLFLTAGSSHEKTATPVVAVAPTLGLHDAGLTLIGAF
jgi:hypothetical protein